VAVTAIIGMIGVLGAGIGNELRDSVSSSGSIVEKTSVSDGDRILDIETAKISFSGKVGFNKGNDPAGSWHVRFINVNDNFLDGKDFYSVQIKSLSFDDSCGKTAHFTALGKLDNQLGWTLTVDASAADPVTGHEPNIRIRLSNPSQLDAYDSSSEFLSVDYCIGQTLVDIGNMNFQ
jgi:hypothetical protein